MLKIIYLLAALTIFPCTQISCSLDLRGKDLRGKNLRGENLNGALLQGSYLQGAYLYRAYLMHAKLNNANLAEAELIEANLIGANLEGADLTGAKIDGMIVGAYTNLKNVKGLSPDQLARFNTIIARETRREQERIRREREACKKFLCLPFSLSKKFFLFLFDRCLRPQEHTAAVDARLN